MNRDQVIEVSQKLRDERERMESQVRRGERVVQLFPKLPNDNNR